MTATRHPDQLPEGIYRMQSAGAGYAASTIAVVQGERLFAHGMFGGTYVGSCRFDPVRKLNQIVAKAHLPPFAPMVTGGKLGPEGAVVDIVTEVKLQGDRARFSFSVWGRSVDASLEFLRPLPGA